MKYSKLIILYIIVSLSSNCYSQWVEIGKIPDAPLNMQMNSDSTGLVSTWSGLYRTTNSWSNTSLCSSPNPVNEFIQDRSTIIHVSVINTSTLNQELEIRGSTCTSMGGWIGEHRTSFVAIDIQGDTIVTNYDDKNVLVSVDYGSSWDTLSMGTFQGSFKKFKILENGSILSITGNIPEGFRIKKSTDMAKTWKWVSQGLDRNITRFAGELEGKLWAIGQDGIVAYTLNSGDSWEPTASSPMSYSLASGHFLNDSVGFVCGGNSISKNVGAVYRTMNGGQTWENISPRMDVFFTTVHFVNDSVGYLTSFDGTVYRTINAGGPAVPDTINEKPNDTSSFVGKYVTNERDILIYPNPGNGVLNIKFENASNASGQIELRDIRGRILSVHTIDQELLEINTSRLSSGMYFLHFDTTEGSFSRRWVKE